MLTIKRAREVVVLCTDLGLKAEHDRAEAEHRQAVKEAAKDSREVDTRVRAAAAAVKAAEAAMRDSELEFVLEAFPRKRWVEFEESNPPRKGDAMDEQFHINISALDGAIAAAIVEVRARATGAPVEFDQADWPALADEISNSQWQQFALAVLRLNNGTTDTPFSLAASSTMRRSEQTSKPLNG